MASVMQMHWKGVTKDQYETVRKHVKWETDTPKGAQFHVCSFADDGMHVLDIWDSPEDFQKFMDTRLGAGIQAAGIQGQPDVKWAPLHATFTSPAYKAV